MTTKAASSSRRLAGMSSTLQDTFTRGIPYLRDFFLHDLGQVRVLKNLYPGVMHFLIFWGVTIQVLGTLINLAQMQLFVPFVELPFPRGNLYLGFELVMDLAGLAILAGVFLALFRRVILRPKTLETRWDDIYALTLLGLIPIVGFLLEVTRLLASAPAWSNWSPIGNLVAGWLRAAGVSREGAAGIHDILFWTHAALGLVLFASIPFTKMRHVIFTPLNVLTRSRRKQGVLEKIDEIEEAEKLGVGQIDEFTRSQLLSFDACVRCGRCEDFCPAAFSGMPYSPRNLMQTLRETMLNTLIPNEGSMQKDQAREPFEKIMLDGTPWFCTTCGACLTNCPAFVNPVDTIVELRRFQALTTGKVPKSVADALRNMERQGNPWGIPAGDRVSWLEGLGVRELAPGEETDVLLFLGCAFAFDGRNQKVARSFVKLLQKLGVDFATLGLDETCCGETARRLGNEYLFQIFAEQNIDAFGAVKFNRIVTQCPHCFNTLKNEYPQMGGNFTVQHYTEYLAELLSTNPVVFSGSYNLQGSIAYHDSCYLGRYNQVYAQPRQLLEKTKSNLVEMARRREDSFCCGGGGGGMWLETDPNTRINHRRLQQVLGAGAQTLATACPYCLIMFEDAIRSKGLGDEIRALDIAELLSSGMEGSIQPEDGQTGITAA